MHEITMFSGSAHQELAAAICHHLDMPLAPTRVTRFANDCLEVQLLANCRERDVYIVQPLAPPVQEHLVELLLMLDAARGASAGRITVVMPHFAYARSDKKNAPRISIAARLMADLMQTSGADRVLTMTLHSPQVHGFFGVPVDHLHARHELAQHFRRGDLTNSVVVSPDLGYAKEASRFARQIVSCWSAVTGRSSRPSGIGGSSMSSSVGRCNAVRSRGSEERRRRTRRSQADKKPGEAQRQKASDGLQRCLRCASIADASCVRQRRDVKLAA